MYNKINEDLTSSLKNGDKFRLSVLRMLKSALQLEKINKKGELSDEDVLMVIKRQVKQRNDSIREYESLNKLEVVNDLKKEVEILSDYLPEEASVEEINKVIDDAFNEIKPTSMKEMGLIMKYALSHLSNADNSVVSKLVKERLTK